jgi:hypothetical protein
MIVSDLVRIASANLQDVPVTGSQPGNTGYMLASFRKLRLSQPIGLLC